jgi:hypothetical protein
MARIKQKVNTKTSFFDYSGTFVLMIFFTYPVIKKKIIEKKRMIGYFKTFVTIFFKVKSSPKLPQLRPGFYFNIFFSYFFSKKYIHSQQFLDVIKYHNPMKKKRSKKNRNPNLQ